LKEIIDRKLQSTVNQLINDCSKAVITAYTGGALVFFHATDGTWTVTNDTE